MTRASGGARRRDTASRSDGELVELARRGERAAYAELWRRHASAGIAVARSHSPSLDAEDLVAEAFSRIFATILAGGGPQEAFRPYLFTTIRNTAAGWGKGRRELPVEDAEAIEDPRFSADTAELAIDGSLAVEAYRRLPVAWQEALWYAEVEGLAPRELAPLLGLSPNAAAALAYRAREGLRLAWIEVHIARTPEGSECRWTVERLAPYLRGKVTKRARARIEEHVAGCTDCAEALADAREAGSRLGFVLLLVSAGAAGATGYAAWLAGAQAGSGGVAVAGAAAVAMPGGVVPGGGAAVGVAGGSGAGAGVAGAAGAGGAVAGVSLLPAVAGSVLVIGAVAVSGSLVLPAMYGTGAERVISAAPEAAGVPRSVVPSEEPSKAAVPPAGKAVATVAPEPPGSSSAPRGTPSAAPSSVSSPVPVAPGGPPVSPPPTVPPVDPPGAPEAPVVTAADTGGGLYFPVLSGTGEPGATVVVALEGGTAPGMTAAVSEAGRWTALAFPLATPGSHRLTVTQSRPDGTASAATTVEVALTVPRIEVRAERHGYRVAVTGVPSARVEFRVAGVTRWIHARLPESGHASVTVPWWPAAGLAAVEVRYADGGRVGVAVTVPAASGGGGGGVDGAAGTPATDVDSDATDADSDATDATDEGEDAMSTDSAGVTPSPTASTGD